MLLWLNSLFIYLFFWVFLEKVNDFWVEMRNFVEVPICYCLNGLILSTILWFFHMFAVCFRTSCCFFNICKVFFWLSCSPDSVYSLSFSEGGKIQWSTCEVGSCDNINAWESYFARTESSGSTWTWRSMECFESCNSCVLFSTLAHLHLLFASIIKAYDHSLIFPVIIIF